MVERTTVTVETYQGFLVGVIPRDVPRVASNRLRVHRSDPQRQTP